jgi:DNA-directed RNA polymerase specialized sigma24 family protein
VADNRITDLFRKKKPVSISYSENARNDEDGPLTLEEILPSLGSTPEDEDVKELIWEAIEETLSDLPEEQREVFVATEFDELTVSISSGMTAGQCLGNKKQR